MVGRLRGNKVEMHITLLPETAKELEALMKHERELTPSSCIDRAIHARYSRLPSDIKKELSK